MKKKKFYSKKFSNISNEKVYFFINKRCLSNSYCFYDVKIDFSKVEFLSQIQKKINLKKTMITNGSNFLDKSCLIKKINSLVIKKEISKNKDVLSHRETFGITDNLKFKNSKKQSKSLDKYCEKNYKDEQQLETNKSHPNQPEKS